MSTFQDPRMQTFASVFQKTHFLMPLVLGDLSEEDARKRSRDGEGPSIAWTVGHMLGYRIGALALLGVERDDPYGPTYVQRGATDGSDYPSLSEMSEQWNALNTEMEAVLSRTDPTVLDRPLSGPGGHGEETLNDKLAFIAWHEAYHMGALGALRKSLGYPGPAERVMQAMEAGG